jgi:hypothetical protein
MIQGNASVLEYLSQSRGKVWESLESAVLRDNQNRSHRPSAKFEYKPLTVTE